MLHSFPRRQQRGRSMNSTRGFGFTVKWRNRLTTSRSVRIPDWAGPAEEQENHEVVSPHKLKGILARVQGQEAHVTCKREHRKQDFNGISRN